MLHTRIPTTSTHAFSDGFFAVDTENLLNRAGARRGETPLHKHILRLTDSYVGFLSVENIGFSRNHRSPSCINANLNMRKISMSIDPTKKRQGKNIRVLLFVCLSRLWFLFIMWLISPFILLLPFLLFCIREHWFFFLFVFAVGLRGNPFWVGCWCWWWAWIVMIHEYFLIIVIEPFNELSTSNAQRKIFNWQARQYLRMKLIHYSHTPDTSLYVLYEY